MKKRFAINLSFLLFVNLLVKPFWILGIDRVVQNKVGPEVYGTYFAVFNYSFLFSMILDFGINNFNSRAVSRNNKRLGEYLVNIMLLKFFLSLIYLVITFITAVMTGFSEVQLKMLVALIFNQIILSAILYFRTNIAALQMFKTDAIISVLDRSLTIFFCLALLYSSQFKDIFRIEWFIYAQTISLLITALVAFVILLPKASIKSSIWKFRFTKKILLKSLPFALIALTMGIYYRIDGVMIERMLGINGAKEAGIYAASYRLLDALNMFGYLFSIILLPLFSGMIRKKESVKSIFKFSCELMLVISVIATAGCFTFSKDIMALLYHTTNLYWSQIFSWLILSFIPISLVYIFGALLLAKGDLLLINIITLGGALLNVLLNYFLIPSHGALGAVYATLITQMFVAVSFGFSIIRGFRFTIDMLLLLKCFVFMIVSFGVTFILNGSGLYWIPALIFSSVITLIFSFLFRVLSFSDLILLKNIRNNTLR